MNEEPTIDISINTDDLTDTQQQLLLYLALDADKNKEVRLTNAELARIMGFSTGYINVGLNKLEQTGKISRHFVLDYSAPAKFIRIIKLK